MTETTVLPATWTAAIDADVAASIYALPPAARVEGALAATGAGLWVHADVILQRTAAGAFENAGVDVSTVLEILARAPRARVEVHLMVPEPADGWMSAANTVIRQLATVGVTRWAGAEAILEMLIAGTPDGTQCWLEVYSPRDGDVTSRGGADGMLVMLIPPGTTEAADLDSIRTVQTLATAGVRVGVDGGVTPELAGRVVAAGGSHLVVGRALWGS